VIGSDRHRPDQRSSSEKVKDLLAIDFQVDRFTSQLFQNVSAVGWQFCHKGEPNAKNFAISSRDGIH
jgi:hypothetical protein